MQKKRNIQLLMLLCVLLVSTGAVYFFISSNHTNEVNKTLFKVSNLKAIDRVELISTSTKIELKLNGTRWKINEQPVDFAMIDVLFATLQQVEPKRPVASSMADSVNRLLEQQGIIVKLFEGETLQKEFVAGGNVSKTQAYFKDKETEEIYVMVIPGYRVYASGIFELDENGWKDKYVFNFNWKNFKQLKASFPANPNRNFNIEMGRDYFEVSGLPAADTTKLNNFLDAISLTTVDQYVSEKEVPGFDSQIQAGPQMEISVLDISGKEYKLSLYAPVNNDFVLAKINSIQPAYISKQKLRELVKDKAWFLGK